jgi:metal-dependent amidase/aminoacylase/carboxypeptidase family protein
LTNEVQDLLENRIREVVEGTAKVHGAKAVLKYKRGYPVTRNHPDQAAFAASVAKEIVGDTKVDTDVNPVMGAETSRSCSTRGRAPSSLSAMATAQACITRLTTSMTTSSRSDRRIGCGSPEKALAV